MPSVSLGGRSLHITCTTEVLEDVFETYGFLRLLAANNRPEFIATELELPDGNRTSHHKSSFYHPATNGSAENMVKMSNSG